MKKKFVIQKNSLVLADILRYIAYNDKLMLRNHSERNGACLGLGSFSMNILHGNVPGVPNINEVMVSRGTLSE